MKLWIVTTPYSGSTFPMVFDSEAAALANSGGAYDAINIRTLNATDCYGKEHRAEETALGARISGAFV